MNSTTQELDHEQHGESGGVDHNAVIVWLGLLAAAIVYFNYRPVTLYVATHWLYDYEFGFIERGMVGSVGRIFFGNLAFTYKYINISSSFLLLILSSLIVYLCYIAISISRNIAPLLISLAFITSPGSLAYFSFDTGRFDTINYIILLATIITLRHARLSVLYCLMIGTLVAIAILIHEPFFVTGLPVVCAMLIYRGVQIRSLTIFFVPVIAAAIAVAVFGRTNIDIDTYMTILSSRADFKPHEWVLETFYRTIFRNIVLSVEYAKNQDNLWQYLLMMGVLLPGNIVAVKLTKPNTKFLVACSAPTLFLLIIAIDHGRWLALATTNLMLASLWLLSIKPELARPVPNLQRTVLVVGVVIVSAALFGHVPVQLGYPSGLVRN